MHVSRANAIALVVLLVGAVVVGVWVSAPDAREGDGSHFASPPEGAAGSAAPTLRGSPLPEPEAVDLAPTTPEDEEAPAPDATSYMVMGVLKDAATDEPLEGVDVVGRHSVAVPGERAGFSTKTESLPAEMLGGGRFRLVVEGDPPRYLNAFTLDTPGWSVLRTKVVGAKEESPHGMPLPKLGTVTDVIVWARRSFHLQGHVQDEGGAPLGGVQIDYATTVTVSGRNHIIGRRQVPSAEDGSFSLGPFPEDPKVGLNEGMWSSLESLMAITFHKEGHAVLRVDPGDVPVEERGAWVVTMSRGVTLAGTVVDPWGHPLVDVPVVVEYGTDWNLRRGVRTDEAGRFRLENLSHGKATLSARAPSRDLRAKRELTIEDDDDAVRLVAEAITPAVSATTSKVLGLEVADVTDDLRRAFELPDHVHVVILHPGEDPKALGIGLLERGYGIFHVGDKPVSSVRAMVEALLEGTTDHRSPGARIVYTFWNERLSGTNTQYVRITPEQRAELELLLEQLPRPEAEAGTAAK
ncbi:MAG: carboxypeptidase regulatory-like domain-containing protein [Planctomycetota bacterium]